jgi:hypothetical protein
MKVQKKVEMEYRRVDVAREESEVYICTFTYVYIPECIFICMHGG